jgi:hypothetical protein
MQQAVHFVKACRPSAQHFFSRQIGEINHFFVGLLLLLSDDILQPFMKRLIITQTSLFVHPDVSMAVDQPRNDDFVLTIYNERVSFRYIDWLT